MIPTIKYDEFLGMTVEELESAKLKLLSNLRRCEIAIKERNKYLR